MNAQDALLFVISVFCISTMFALGLEVTLTEISAPFRNWLAVAILVLANNVLVPLLALVILAASEVLPQPFGNTVKDLLKLVDNQRIGFLLVALAAGGILGPTLVDLAKGSIALAKGTTLILVLASIILMPVEISLLGQSNHLFDPNTVDALSIFNTLLLFQLLPLAVGIGIKTWYDDLAMLIRPWIGQLASLSFLVLLVLFPAANQGLLSWLGNFPTQEVTLVRTDAKTVSGLIDALNNKQGQALADSLNPISNTVSISPNAKVYDQQDSPVKNDLWKVVDGGKTYNIVAEGGESTDTITVTAVMPYWFSTELPTGNTLGTDLQNRSEAEPTKVPSDLQNAFTPHGVTLSDKSVITQASEINGWKITDSGNIYAIQLTDLTLRAYSQALQSTGLVADVIQFLYKLPTLAAVLEFLKQLFNIVLPLAAYSAVAFILLKVGYYAGLLLNNATGATTLNVARTEAIAVAVRNVSAALIVAAKHFSTSAEQETDLSAVGVILIFYTISLIVAAIQADKWSRQPETAPVAPASQSQTAVIAPERGVGTS